MITYVFVVQSSEKIILKKYKEHRPASQRVAEAAEYLMCVLFEHKVRFIYLYTYIYRQSWIPLQTINRITNLSQRSVTGACLHAELTGDILNEEVFNRTTICCSSFRSDFQFIHSH